MGRAINCGIAACLAMAVLLIATAGAVSSAPKRVLLLHSFGREFPPFSDISGWFRDELVRQLPEQADIYEVSLETARFSEGEHEAPFVAYLQALFSHHNFDLVVCIGGPASRFAQRRRSELFPSTPMLFLGVNQRLVLDAGASMNDAVIPVKVDLPLIVENILRTIPKTTTIAVVIGNSPLEKFWLGEMRREFAQFANRVEFYWFNDLPFEEMRHRAASLPPRSAILFTILYVDSSGMPQDQGRALASLHTVANAPIFGAWEDEVGRGIIGGPVISARELGRRAAAIAGRIFRGDLDVGGETAPVGPDTWAFDWRELQRWGVSESRLPPGSEIRFREPSAWERYRWQIIVLVSALALQSAIITWLLVEYRRRRAAELESRRRVLEVVHLNRTAAAGALSASIAHELNQPLGAILANTEAAELLLARNPSELGPVKEILSDIRQADQHATEIIHRVGKLLKRRVQIEVQEFDLNDAIAEALRVLSPEALKRGITLSAYGVKRSLPVLADQIHLQQVLMNLVANGMDAMAEAAPGTRAIAIEAALNGQSEVVVSVADQGTGIPKGKLKDVFDTFYTTKEQGTGLGLSIARTIVETYGGKIWAENRAAGGAVFRFTLPLVERGPT